MAPQTRPFIGVNVDYVAPSKHTQAHLRLPLGYVDSLLAAGGLPILLPPLGKEKELNAFLDRVNGRPGEIPATDEPPFTIVHGGAVGRVPRHEGEHIFRGRWRKTVLRQ